MWFDVNIANLSICQVFLVSPAAKFDKTYLHLGITSGNRNYDKFSGGLLKMCWSYMHKINTELVIPFLVIETPLPIVSQKCIYYNRKPIKYELFLQHKKFSLEAWVIEFLTPKSYTFIFIKNSLLKILCPHLSCGYEVRWKYSYFNLTFFYLTRISVSDKS